MPSASVSLREGLWDPCRVLDVDPNNPKCFCVGVNGYGNRCGWRFEKTEQFSPAQRATAAKQLKSMSAMHPSEITSAALYSLAQNTLCSDFHQGQAGAVEDDWRRRIDIFAREHGERLELAGAFRRLQVDMARDNEASEQEIKRTRQGLEASEARCSELTGKNNDLERQLTELHKTAKTLDERNVEVERLKSQMEARNANFERNIAASSKEIKGLKDSKARLDSITTANTLEIASLKAKVRDRDQALDERAKRSEGDAESLGQQLAASNREIGILKEAKAAIEERAKLSEREAESLRKALRESNARHDAKSSEYAKRLGDQIGALDQKFTESKKEGLAQISQLHEQSRKIDRLIKQMDGVMKRDQRVEEMMGQELTKRDGHIEQLEKDVEMVKQESAERGGRVEQLVQQMEGLKLDLTEQEERLMAVQPQKKGLFAKMLRKSRGSRQGDS